MKDLNKKVREKFENFFDWVKGAELVELQSCNPEEDPIRPELNNDFRTSYGRKIYGVNILLSVDLPNKKHKKLIIPYIPHQKENNLIMNQNNIISMAVDMTAHLKYF